MVNTPREVYGNKHVGILPDSVKERKERLITVMSKGILLSFLVFLINEAPPTTSVIYGMPKCQLALSDCFMGDRYPCPQIMLDFVTAYRTWLTRKKRF